MTIDEIKAELWQGIHGLALDTLINNLATTRYANEQLLAANSTLAKENEQLKGENAKLKPQPEIVRDAPPPPAPPSA